jgi:adenylate kinase family enzyme
VNHRIRILGASDSGTTTLGKTLAALLKLPHFDSDDYFWLPTSPPFQKARPRPEQEATLESALADHSNWVLSGSCCGWGDFIIPKMTLVVFLFVRCEIRIERLRAREIGSYGESALRPGGEMATQHTEFLEWASRYDDGGTT